jgi:hypothetical protein
MPIRTKMERNKCKESFLKFAIIGLAACGLPNSSLDNHPRQVLLIVADCAVHFRIRINSCLTEYSIADFHYPALSGRTKIWRTGT